MYSKLWTDNIQKWNWNPCNLMINWFMPLNPRHFFLIFVSRLNQTHAHTYISGILKKFFITNSKLKRYKISIYSSSSIVHCTRKYGFSTWISCTYDDVMITKCRANSHARSSWSYTMNFLHIVYIPQMKLIELWTHPEFSATWHKL